MCKSIGGILRRVSNAGYAGCVRCPLPSVSRWDARPCTSSYSRLCAVRAIRIQVMTCVGPPDYTPPLVACAGDACNAISARCDLNQQNQAFFELCNRYCTCWFREVIRKLLHPVTFQCTGDVPRNPGAINCDEMIGTIVACCIRRVMLGPVGDCLVFVLLFSCQLLVVFLTETCGSCCGLAVGFD